MKQWISGILIFMCSMVVQAQTSVNDDYSSLEPDDKKLLARLVDWVDNGMTEMVIPDFDSLAKKYPDNYLIQYERLYNLYMLGKYDEVIKKRKFMLNHKNSNAQTYQLIGNSYDYSGDKKKAAQVYIDGLKRYPDSGMLYMELGTLYLSDNEYNKALECYNRGIIAQPNFASNYYRAASLYLSSVEAKVWGLVYAETAILLAPSNESRHEEMSKMITDCFKENIKMSFGADTELSVTLVPSRNISVGEGSNIVYLAFPGIYEGATVRPLLELSLEKTPFMASISQLIKIRKGIVETYYSVTDNLYGDSMYLLEFHKKIIDAGHWDAYNYFLFRHSSPDEFDEWYSANSADLDAFINWYNNEPFSLGNGCSVDNIQIFNSYRPIDMLEALQIQAQLIGESSNTEVE